MGKWTRRGFIVAGAGVGGALVVGVVLRPGNRLPELSPMVTVDGETLINSFVKVGADNRVTVIVPHAEMGIVRDGYAAIRYLSCELCVFGPHNDGQAFEDGRVRGHRRLQQRAAVFQNEHAFIGSEATRETGSKQDGRAGLLSQR